MAAGDDDEGDREEKRIDLSPTSYIGRNVGPVLKHSLVLGATLARY